MLIKSIELNSYKLNGSDGDVGKVKEFYLDDKFWTIRYLVVDTGGWLTGQQVLISPYAIAAVNNVAKCIDIDLSKKQIKNSPPLESDKPVSRQFELGYYGYYGYPMYWAGPSMWGYYPDIVRNNTEWKKIGTEEHMWDAHLRSTKEVSGYHIQAKDGEIGHVVDFIIDDETWAIRYLVIDTTNWFAGKKVLISPKWIDKISWNDSKVFINLSTEEIKLSPEYTEEALLTRDYESQLHKYYNRHVYWPEDPLQTNQML